MTAERDTNPVGSVSAGGKLPFWIRAASGWCQAGGSGEASFVRPGRPLSWRRDAPVFAAECGDLDLDADRRVIETVRQRALEGDPHAHALAFRASRGPARSVDLTPLPTDTEFLSPEVAEAMIDAGLAALNGSMEPGSFSYPQ